MRIRRSGRALGCSLVALGTAWSLSAGAGPTTQTADFGKMEPGTSVVGSGIVHPQLVIEDSNGNDVVALKEFVYPVAFGGNHSGVKNVANACLGSGFADVGRDTYTPETKQHKYRFSFTPGVTVNGFSVRMLDWGDYLPFGTNADQKYAFTMKAYNAAGNEVDADTIQFTSASTVTNGRPSNEFGELEDSGDACTATEGQPGNYRFDVTGSGIVLVTLEPRDRPSLDPHIAFTDLEFDLEPVVVPIDIRPGTFPNPINVRSQGTVPVAILSTATFSAASVLPASVTLAGVPVALKKNGTPQASLAKMNGDSLPDLLLHFPTAGLPTTSSKLKLFGSTTDGKPITGTDTVKFVR